MRAEIAGRTEDMSGKTVRTARASDGASVAPQPLARMQTFAPYEQGKSEIDGRKEVIKLSSNECCFGPSPAAIDAFHEAASELHRYPDGSQASLRQAIAKAHGIDADRIVCGNGSEEIIGLLIRCYLGKGDELLLSENHFIMYIDQLLERSAHARPRRARIVDDVPGRDQSTMERASGAVTCINKHCTTIIEA